MDLWCDESSSPTQLQNASPAETQPDGILALADQNLLSDERVLEKLLQTELRCLPQKPDFVYSCLQQEVRPHMRKILTTWMLEVCEELGCEAIFPLAVNYVDRFLSKTQVSKSQLQLLGAVCLLIASKLRQCKSIHPQDLAYFSDYSYTTADITEWEMLLLTTLRWDVSAVVSTDFIEHLIVRIHLMSDILSPTSEGFAEITAQIKQFATDLCLLCCREIEFVNENPSVLATASLATALRAVLSHHSHVSWDGIAGKAEEVTGIDGNLIRDCIRKLGEMMASTGHTLKSATAHSAAAAVTTKYQAAFLHKTVICNSSHQHNSAPETPTDVQDVMF